MHWKEEMSRRGDVQPGHRRAKQSNRLSLLSEEANNLYQTRSGRRILRHFITRLRLRNWIQRISLLPIPILPRIHRRLLDIIQHIERVPRRLGNGQTVVKRKPPRYAAKCDDDAPHLVDGHGALADALAYRADVDEGVFVCDDDD